MVHREEFLDMRAEMGKLLSDLNELSAQKEQLKQN